MMGHGILLRLLVGDMFLMGFLSKKYPHSVIKPWTINSRVSCLV